MAEEEVNVVGIASKKNKDKPDKKVVVAAIGILVLALGVVAGIILVKQQQDIREKASSSCPAAEQCPGSDGILRSCDNPESDGSPAESMCNTAFKGRVEICGGEDFCCNGSNWTTNMTACSSSPTATATARPTSTSSPTATPTKTATSTATSSSQASSTSVATKSPTPTSTSLVSETPFPVPDTGSSWVTILGVGLGVLMVAGSLILAL